MEHYITKIKINKLRHLSNITISLNPKNRQNLIITGKNGSGKTSLLSSLQKNLQALSDGQLTYFFNLEKNKKNAKIESENQNYLENYHTNLTWIRGATGGLDIQFSNFENLDKLFWQGDFITAFFPANRKTNIIRSHGVTDIKLREHYSVNDNPGELFHQYLVHLKTQQSYARNEGDIENVDRIQTWFNRFTDALQILLDDNSISLEYDYKNYNFKIHETGRIPFGLDELSDGYSSVIHIVSDLILRMDKNWLLGDRLSQYNAEGIVLIDELETHLHLELQKKILPFLTTFFPRIQFIVTTHSPYILNSVSNAKAYDLERCVELDNLSSYSSDILAEGYFETDEYSDKLKEKIARYKILKEKAAPTEEERAKLRIELKNIPSELSEEIFNETKGVHL